jgi:hypothetical protein
LGREETPSPGFAKGYAEAGTPSAMMTGLNMSLAGQVTWVRRMQAIRILVANYKILVENYKQFGIIQF